jgi:hypothetical protein
MQGKVHVHVAGAQPMLAQPMLAHSPLLQLSTIAPFFQLSPIPRFSNYHHTLSATRDKAPTVRKEAYNYIKTKVEVTALKVDDRLKLLKEGLNDRDSGARTAAVSMLCKHITTFPSHVSSPFS